MASSMQQQQQQQQHSVIIYFEDPSYPSVPDEESREIVRQWRYRLERVLGLYNAKLDHKCSERCLEPIRLPSLVDDPIRDARDDEDDYKYVAGPINERHNVFGCPRSGIVHWCPPYQNLREKTCQFLGQNREHATVCQYSKRLVFTPEWEFDPYVDTTISLHRQQGGESSEDREARIAAGLDRNHQPAQKITHAQKEERERATVELRTLKRHERSLEGMHKRRQNAKTAPIINNNKNSTPALSLESTQQDRSVVPAIERSPRKISVAGPSTNSSKILLATAAAAGGGPSSRKTRYEAGHDLTVTLDTQRSMKRIIIDLIASPEAHADMKHPTAALTAPATDPYFEMCLKRIARIYALISKERDLVKQRNNDRNRRGNACASLNVRDITVTTLYTYARGYNIDNQNLIPIDERLTQLLPNPKNLQWYGIDPAARQHLLMTNEKPPEQTRLYREGMTTKALDQIQQMIRNYPRGIEHLRTILEDD